MFRKGIHVSDAKGRFILAGAGVNILGARLELKISKRAFSKCTYDDIKAFYQELERVCGVNYATIVFNDGTGLFFVNCLTACPEYGRVDRDGCIDGLALGYVKDMGSYFTLTDDQDRQLTGGTSGKGVNGINEPLNSLNTVQLCS